MPGDRRITSPAWVRTVTPILLMTRICVPPFRASQLLRLRVALMAVLAGWACVPTAALADGEKLLATGGIVEIDGAGGGGLTPWALISGLETDREIGGSAACTYVRPEHFALTSCAAAIGIEDRVEFSFAEQRFNLDDVAPGHEIRQDVFGAKVRLLGDAVYDQDRWWPQLALGAQYKRNLDFDFVPQLIGAKHQADTDFYLSATKVYLDGPFGRTWLIDATLRATRANQFGILGFGGDRSDSYSYVGEGSLGVFLSDSVVLGGEYREKPNNLSAFREQDAHDVFLSWFPCKYFSVTAAYVSLGDIAIHANLNAWYVSVQGGF
jgi:hypothetical protein